MRRTLLVFWLVAVGCGRPGLRAVVGDVELTPRVLHFERGWVGHPTQATLTLHNGARADQPMTLRCAAPFACPAQLLVPGGAQVALTVTFLPTAAGVATGTLQVSSGQQTVDVPLDGEARVPPACASAELCRLSHFSPEAGGCVETSAANGTACSSERACAVNGSCVNGACMGSSPDCSDQNPCTLDSCQPGGGCQHAPKTCAAPSNPCKAALCDPALGCVEADAPDGTACGPADCTSARVCLLGACTTRAVPEGAACGEPTPCQDRGVCQSNSCVKPAPTALKEAWNHPFPGAFDFRGVSDAAQNLYWLECPTFGIQCDGCMRCEALSATRDGVERFRADLGPVPPVGISMLAHVLTHDRLVAAANGTVTGISARSGAVLWTRPLSAVLQNAPDVANTQFVSSMAADGVGNVLVHVRRYHDTPNAAFPRAHALVTLDSATGTVGRVQFLDGELTGLVLDEHDDVYFGFYPRALSGMWAAPELRSLDASGAERWRVVRPALSVTPLSAFNGQLVLGEGRVASTVDGSTLFHGPAEGVLRNPLMTATQRTLMLPPNVTKPVPLPAQTVTAISMPVSSDVVSWAGDVAGTNGQLWYGLVSDLAAAANGDTLVAGAFGSQATALTALTSTGATRFSCVMNTSPAGLTLRYDSAVALLDGRWAAVESSDCDTCDFGEWRRLRVFEVPGERPARHGWVAGAGGPGGGARPLP